MATPVMPPEPAPGPGPSAPGLATASTPAPIQVPTSVPSRRALAATAIGSFTARVLLALAGAGLTIGFFFPWFKLGGVAHSGLGLMVLQGDVVQFVSWPQRAMLFAVPMFGVGLAVAAFTGHRLALWIALGASALVLGGGAYTLITVFFGVTGVGMWILVGSALLSLAVAMLTLGRVRK